MERWRLGIFAGGLMLCTIGVGWLAWVISRPGRGAAVPEVFAEVGSFRLTNHAGRRFGSTDLAGRVWIASVVFTRCQGPCPLITERMQALDRDLPPDVRLVTITADPGHDTPGVLRRYIRDRDLNTGRWTFLTGSKADLRTLLRDRFRLPTGDPSMQSGVLVIPHTEKLVLVDGRGRIRGYCESGSPDELVRLRQEARRLLAEPPAAPGAPTGG